MLLVVLGLLLVSGVIVVVGGVAAGIGLAALVVHSHRGSVIIVVGCLLVCCWLFRLLLFMVLFC